MPEISVLGPARFRVVPITLTAICAVLLPAVAVTVITRSVGSPAVTNWIVAAPLLPVTAGLVPDKPPEVAEKFTETAGSSWLLAPRTSAVMVAGCEPLDGICGSLVVKVMVCCALITWTTIVPSMPPEAAVTVIFVPEATPLPDTVALATPLASVVPETTTTEPAEAEKATVTPLTALRLAFSAVAVMAAAKSFFPEDHPQFVGVYWGEVSSPGTREIVDWADGVICLGTIFNDYSTVGWTAMPSGPNLLLADKDSVRLSGSYFNRIHLRDFLVGLAAKVEKRLRSR